MYLSHPTGFKRSAFARLASVSVALVLAMSARFALAGPSVTTMATLLDRIQIEDMLVEYYGHLGGGHDFGSFYAPDGILDVNGIIAQGQKPIEELYAKIRQQSTMPRGTFHMLITNPRIVVNGNSATADVIWTGIVSDVVTAPPRFVEQGREHDDLVKSNGQWLIKHRTIISDSGLTSMFEKTYTKR